MAIEHIKMRRIARELQEWVYLGIDDGMVRSAQDYKRLTAEGRTTEAENMLKRSADMPFRALARVEAFEAQYGTEYVDKCLELYGDVTLAELKAAIVDKQKPALEFAKKIIDDKVDNLVIADDITANVSSNAKDWIFPIPATHKEICEVEVEKIKKAEDRRA